MLMLNYRQNIVDQISSNSQERSPSPIEDSKGEEIKQPQNIDPENSKEVSELNYHQDSYGHRQ